jgi:antitoxin ParD1/3/4
MPAKHSRHIAWTETLASWVDAQVAEGQVAKREYASASDLIRTAIRALRSRDEYRGAPGPASPARPPRVTGRA